jgi:hypothetical protein
VARHKDFAGGTNIDDFEPLTFTLNRQNFTCVPAIQGSTLLEFVAQADGESGGAAAGALYQFFENCMEAPEYARFQALLKDPKVIIDMELIGEIAGWLVEEYTARPTKRPVNSSPGPENSGQPSMAEQS